MNKEQIGQHFIWGTIHHYSFTVKNNFKYILQQERYELNNINSVQCMSVARYIDVEIIKLYSKEESNAQMLTNTVYTRV